ncbi:MAG TPA: glycerol-3-phosphate 1-O-acyltransferase PlsY [Candidatus Dormibacteraeota bacterium]|nr:glycerol-3-phosphate 1-O-acyltransferase PlsY [Candidatus Dormibacteraeota bacterium]
MIVAAALVAAFVVGSIPFGIVVGRGLFGVDIRSLGSGNIGAANAFRALPKWGAALVLVGDALKGLLPVLAAQRLALDPWWVVAVGLAAILGHNYSLFLGGRGGKGVATGLGVLIALSPPAALASIAVWVAVVLITGYASLGSILLNLAQPFALWGFTRQPADAVFGSAAFLLVLWRHRENVHRLLHGREHSLFKRRTAP